MGKIVGRERELSLAEGFLGDAGERLSVLLIEGEAGIGKTTVWREIVRRARDRGFVVLSCRPAEAEAELAIAALADLLDAVPGDAVAALPAPQRRAVETALLRADRAETTVAPRTLATAVTSLLAGSTRERPLLVAVDDAQWLDATSATVLQFALRRLESVPLGWLLARRTPEPVGLAAERSAPPDSLTRLTIGPLTLAGLHHVVEDRLDAKLARPALVRVHELSAGNPFYALEIVRELQRAGTPVSGAPLPVPGDLRELLARRLQQLPAHTRDALLAAAALANPTTALVDERSLAPAEEAGLVRVDPRGHIEFQHPLYAAAVYESAPRARTRDVHRRLARVVSDPEEHARHVAIATDAPDEIVAGMLEQRAAVARAPRAWASAAELLEQASALTPPERLADAHRRRVAAAEHHVHAGDRPRARALLEDLLGDARPRRPRADALALLAEITHEDGNYHDAVRLFAEALTLADEPRLVAEAELGLSYTYASLMDWEAGAVHSRRALAAAHTLGDEAIVASALAHCVMLDFCRGRGVDWPRLERALELERDDPLLPYSRRARTLAALLLLYVGRHEEARRSLRTLCAAARERGDESNLAFVLIWLSWLETRSGNFDAAGALADEAATAATLTGSHSMHAWALTQRAYVHAHRGDMAETRGACQEASDPVVRSGNLLPPLWIAASLTLLELSRGDARAAWQACEPAVEALERQGLGEPVPAFFLPDALEALVTLGEVDRAARLLDAFEGRARELDRVWALATGARCRALVLAARGDLAAADAAAEHALDEHERLDMPFELARTLLGKGVVERRLRRRGRARETLADALAAFERLGTRLWAERARHELDRLGMRRRPRHELTEGERRIAELVASGMTNREVAAALFVSPKTVEAQLARAYQKLGIGSRAELGAQMAARPKS